MSRAAGRPWAEVASRAQKLRGPDIQIDAEVMCLSRGGVVSAGAQSRMQFGWSAGCMMPGGSFPEWFDLPRYSASVDDTLAMIEARQPGAGVKTWSPHFVAAVRIGDSWGESAGATLPLALLAAFALAMDAAEDGPT